MDAPTPAFMIGVGLAGVGLIGAYGSVTGYLPAMIAALFYPSLLTAASDAGPTAKLGPKTQQYLQQKANPNENVKVRQNMVLGR